MLVWAGFTILGDTRLPSDAGIWTTCPTCQEKQALAEATVEHGDETVYTCKNGCQPILIVGAPGSVPWPGRGYRIKDWSLRNAADLTFRAIDQQGQSVGGEILMRASPNALADESEAPEQ